MHSIDALDGELDSITSSVGYARDEIASLREVIEEVKLVAETDGVDDDEDEG